MSVLGLDHVNIAGPAELIDRVRNFYVDVIGLVEGARPSFHRRGYWLYAGEHAVVHLTVSDDATGATGSFNHFALSCEGLNATIERLKKHGVAYELAHVPQTNRVQLFVRDPAGVGVELGFREG